MKTCIVKDIEIGKGKPKVCLPLVGSSNEEILKQLESFHNFQYDLLELRIDFYKDVLDYKKVLELLKMLHQKTDKPLLFTYRSLREGGQVQLSDEQYTTLIDTVCQSGCVDMVDIELDSGNALVYKLVDIIHNSNKKVIMSHHNFESTPSVADMIDTLEHMEVLNADILKLAVMPQSNKDVISLINMTIEMSHKLSRPLVTMSMGEIGTISRIAGELTGSAITFASGGKASAPGQIEVTDMNVILEAIHHD